MVTRWQVDLLRIEQDGRDELWKMPATGGPATQITHHGGMAGVEADDGYIYYAKTPRSPTSIWRIPLAGGEEALVIDGLSYSAEFRRGEDGTVLDVASGSGQQHGHRVLRFRLTKENPACRGSGSGGGSAWR